MPERNYPFVELYFIDSLKFKLHYHRKEQYKILVEAVDNFMQIRRPMEMSKHTKHGLDEVRITFTSNFCASVYYKRKQDLE